MKNYSWKDWVIAGLLALTVVTHVGLNTSVPQVIGAAYAQEATTPATPPVPAVPAAEPTVVNPDANVVVVQDPTVTIPYGQWLVAFKELAYPLIGAAIVFLMRSLPESIVSIIRVSRADQLLTKALQAGFNQVVGAAKDKKLSVPVANAVIRKFVQYAVNEGPGWLINWMGGVEGLKAKAIARVQIVDGDAIDPADINVSDIVKGGAA